MEHRLPTTLVSTITTGLLFMVVLGCVGASRHRIGSVAVSCLENGDAACAAPLFHIPPTYSPSAQERERETIVEMLRVALVQLGPIRNARPGHSGAVLQVGIGSGDFGYWRAHPAVITEVYDVTFRNQPGQVWILLTNIEGRSQIREIKFGLPISSANAAQRIGDLAIREARIARNVVTVK